MSRLEPPNHCNGQFWREAIAVLIVRAAEMRLEAAQAMLPASANYDEEYSRWHPLRKEADQLEELADWLRTNTALPWSDEVRADRDMLSVQNAAMALAAKNGLK